MHQISSREVANGKTIMLRILPRVSGCAFQQFSPRSQGKYCYTLKIAFAAGFLRGTRKKEVRNREEEKPWSKRLLPAGTISDLRGSGAGDDFCALDNISARALSRWSRLESIAAPEDHVSRAGPKFSQARGMFLHPLSATSVGFFS